MSKHFYESYEMDEKYEIALKPWAIIINPEYWAANDKFNALGYSTVGLPPQTELCFVVFTNTSNQKFILRLGNTCNGNHFVFSKFVSLSTWCTRTWKVISSLDDEPISYMYGIQYVG